LDAHLRDAFGIELIAPHRDNRVRPATQDGSFAPLQTALGHRTLLRLAAQLASARDSMEHHVENLVGMLQLGCMSILLNRL
jgi:hypothetical protein